MDFIKEIVFELCVFLYVVIVIYGLWYNNFLSIICVLFVNILKSLVILFL